jgi:hypothetical protein
MDQAHYSVLGYQKYNKGDRHMTHGTVGDCEYLHVYKLSLWVIKTNSTVETNGTSIMFATFESKLTFTRS